jgi:hypothetical protein
MTVYSGPGLALVKRFDARINDIDGAFGKAAGDRDHGAEIDNIYQGALSTFIIEKVAAFDIFLQAWSHSLLGMAKTISG